METVPKEWVELTQDEFYEIALETGDITVGAELSYISAAGVMTIRFIGRNETKTKTVFYIKMSEKEMEDFARSYGQKRSKK